MFFDTASRGGRWTAFKMLASVQTKPKSMFGAQHGTNKTLSEMRLVRASHALPYKTLNWSLQIEAPIREPQVNRCYYYTDKLTDGDSRGNCYSKLGLGSLSLKFQFCL